jgi:hypothetical protein
MGIDRTLEAAKRLKAICVYAETGQGHLRTLLDEWAAFFVGGDLLTPSGRQRWFNFPCPWKECHRLFQYMNWITPQAAAILRAGALRQPTHRKPTDVEERRSFPYRLIVEHAVPVAEISRELRRDSGLRRADRAERFLRHHYRRGVLTHAENALLERAVPAYGASLRDRMPTGWKPWGDPYARYRAVGIDRLEFRIWPHP